MATNSAPTSVYAETAWRGEAPETTEFADIPLKPYYQPTLLGEIIFVLALFLIGGLFCLGVVSLPAVVYRLFYHGFIWQQLASDNLFWIVLYCTLIGWGGGFISYFVAQGLRKLYRRGKPKRVQSYIIDIVSGREFHLQSWQHQKEPVIPSRCLSHDRIVPSRFRQKGFVDHFGRRYLSWNERCLTSYQYSYDRWRGFVHILWVFNCFALLGAPLYLYQMTVQPVVKPIYIGLFICQIALLSYGRWLNKRGPRQARAFEFNRQTGMVSHYDEKDQLLWCHPFREFNLYLQVHFPDANSISRGVNATTYSTYFVHRGSPQLTYLDCFVGGQRWADMMDMDSHFQLHATLLNYMDVTCPLPYSIVLEHCRQKDPTTQIYDEAHPEKRVDFSGLTDQEYQALLADFADQRPTPNAIFATR